jgi:hypothetical protein
VVVHQRIQNAIHPSMPWMQFMKHNPELNSYRMPYDMERNGVPIFMEMCHWWMFLLFREEVVLVVGDAVEVE